MGVNGSSGIACIGKPVARPEPHVGNLFEIGVGCVVGIQPHPRTNPLHIRAYRLYR